MKNHDPKPRGEPSGHDHNYKILFSHPETVKELLRGFLREDWVQRLDFSTLQRVSGSFVSTDMRERHTDVIWRVRFRGDRKHWFYLYVLLEFQSTPYHFMAVRLLGYVSLLLQDAIKKHKLKPGDRLPPILPVLLYTGKRPWRAPLDLASLYPPVPLELRRYLPDLTYILLDQGKLDLKNPALAANRIATLFRIEVCNVREELPGLLRHLKDLTPAEREPELQHIFAVWLRAVFRRTFPGVIIPELLDLEGASMLEENLRSWIREERREGRKEGVREGQVEGMREIVLDLLTQRFGRLSFAVRRQVEAISSIPELRKLGRRVLVAGSLQDMGFQ